jgi:F0F1-type ATP synthase membrane subunit c/vacuolar-type H+-ATPase subunit K
VNYNFITINGLRKGEKVYLALNRINEEHESDSTGFGFWTFFLVGIGIMGSGIYQFYLGAKPAHNTSHQNRGSK